jgi:hypothetical protein
MDVNLSRARRLLGAVVLLSESRGTRSGKRMGRPGLRNTPSRSGEEKSLSLYA